jgi:hypothetical protein
VSTADRKEPGRSRRRIICPRRTLTTVGDTVADVASYKTNPYWSGRSHRTFLRFMGH